MLQRSQWESDEHSVFWWLDNLNKDNIVNIKCSDWHKTKTKRVCAIDSLERHYDIWSSFMYYIIYIRLIHKAVSTTLHSSDLINYII